MEQVTNVVVCPVCKGLGVIYEKRSDGTVKTYHGKPVTQVCDMCGGEHVVVERVTTEYFQMTPQVVEEKKKGWKMPWGK